jgi:hypothetical protein
MVAPAPATHVSSSPKPATTQRESASIVTIKDQARILFIHRRNSLSLEGAENLSAAKSALKKTTPALHLHPKTFRIIPRHELQTITQQKP